MDVAPMQVLSRVTRLALHLDRARKQAFADHDLESSEFDVLSALRRSGKPYQLSPGQLVQETLVTSGTMTNRAAVDGAIDAVLEHEHDLLAGLSAAEQTSLANALRTLSRPFDR